MANSLLTINMITREAIELFKNSNEFLKNIDQQYDDSFARDGAKIGQSLRIRLPNDYTVSTGPAAQPQMYGAKHQSGRGYPESRRCDVQLG